MCVLFLIELAGECSEHLLKYPVGQQISGLGNGRFSVWPVLAALLVGLMLALLPYQLSGAVVVGTAVLLLILIQPLFGLLLGLIIGPFGAVESLYIGNLLLDSGQIVFLLTFAVWLGRGVTKRRIVIPKTWLNLPLLVFIGLTCVSVLYAPSTLYGVKEVFKWVEILLVMWIVVDVVSERGPAGSRRSQVGNRGSQIGGGGPAGSRRSQVGNRGSQIGGWPAGSWRSQVGSVEGVVFMLLGAGLSQALIGVWQFGLRGDGPEHFLILGGYYRAFGTFNQPNPFGGYMSMAACLAIGVLVGLVVDQLQGVPFVNRILMLVGAGQGESCPYAEGDNKGSPLREFGWLVFVGGCAAALVAGLVFSWSRGAWLGFGAAMAALVLFFPRRRWLGLGLLVVGGGLFLAGNQFGLIPASISSRVTGFQEDLQFGDVRGVDINDANYAVLERLAHWQAAIGMARDNFWTGVGFGNYEPAYGDYALINWPYPLGHAHNYYLTVLAEIGLPGLVAYLFLWGTVFWQVIRLICRLDWPRRGIALGLLAVWVTLSVHHLVDKLYVNNLYIFLGAMLGLQQVLEKENDSIID